MSNENMTQDAEINDTELTDVNQPTDQLLHEPFTQAEDNIIRNSYLACLVQGILYSEQMVFVAQNLRRPYATVCDRLLELNTKHRKNIRNMKPIALPDFKFPVDGSIWNIFLKYNDPDSPTCKGDKFNAQKGEVGAMAKRLRSSPPALLNRMRKLFISYKSKTTPDPPQAAIPPVLAPQFAPQEVQAGKLLELSSLCTAIAKNTTGDQYQNNFAEGSTTHPSLPSSSCSTEEQQYPAPPPSRATSEEQYYPSSPLSYADLTKEPQYYPSSPLLYADSTSEPQYYPSSPLPYADSTSEPQYYPSSPLPYVDPTSEPQYYPSSPLPYPDPTSEPQFYPSSPLPYAESACGQPYYYPPARFIAESEYFPTLIAPLVAVRESIASVEQEECHMHTEASGGAPVTPEDVLPSPRLIPVSQQATDMPLTSEEDKILWNVYLAHYGGERPPARRRQVTWKPPPYFIAALMEVSPRPESVLVSRIRFLLHQYQWQMGMFKPSTSGLTAPPLLAACPSTTWPRAPVPELKEDSIWELPVDRQAAAGSKYKEMQASLPELGVGVGQVNKCGTDKSMRNKSGPPVLRSASSLSRSSNPPAPLDLAELLQLGSTSKEEQRHPATNQEGSASITPPRRSPRKRSYPDAPIVDATPTLYHDPDSVGRDDSTFHSTSQLSACPRPVKKSKVKQMYTEEEDGLLWSVYLESQRQKQKLSGSLLRPVAQQLNRSIACVRNHICYLGKKLGQKKKRIRTSVPRTQSTSLPALPSTPIPTPAGSVTPAQACAPLGVFMPPATSSTAPHIAQAKQVGGEASLSHTLSGHSSEDTSSQSLSSLTTVQGQNPENPGEETAGNYWGADPLPPSALQMTQVRWCADAQEMSSNSHSHVPSPPPAEPGLAGVELSQLPSASSDPPVQSELPHRPPTASPDLLRQLPSVSPDLAVQSAVVAEISSATAASTSTRSIPFLVPPHIAMPPPAVAAVADGQIKNTLSFSPVEDAYLFSQIRQAIAAHSFGSGTLEEVPTQLGRSKEIVLKRAVMLLSATLSEMLRGRAVA